MDARHDLKLIDFGLGNSFIKGKGLKTSCGSPCFAAPEIINGVEYDPVKVDVWSLGVCLYCMLVGRLPFDEENKKELYRKIRSCSYRTPTYLSPTAASLLTSMLTLSPAARPTPAAMLSHPFFAKMAPSPAGPLRTFSWDDLLIVASSISKVKPLQMKHMLDSSEHNRQTTVYWLLKRRAERGDIDLAAERGRYDDEARRDQLRDKEKKEEKYRRVLEESKDEVRKIGAGVIRSKVRNLAQRRPTEQESSVLKPIITDPRSVSRDRRIQLDPYLSKFKTDGNTRETSIGNVRLSSRGTIKHERAQSLPNDPLAPIPQKKGSQEQMRYPIVGSGKGYNIKAGPLPGRRTRDLSNSSQQYIDAQHLSMLANLSSHGQSSNYPKRPPSLTRHRGSDDTSTSSPRQILNSTVGQSPTEHRRLDSASRGGNSNSQQGAILSKLIQAMAPRKINILIGDKTSKRNNTVM